MRRIRSVTLDSVTLGSVATTAVTATTAEVTLEISRSRLGGTNPRGTPLPPLNSNRNLAERWGWKTSGALPSKGLMPSALAVGIMELELEVKVVVVEQEQEIMEEEAMEEEVVEAGTGSTGACRSRGGLT